jgi:RNA polymerase sigma-70 factor (ECF subfamily)
MCDLTTPALTHTEPPIVLRLLDFSHERPRDAQPLQPAEETDAVLFARLVTDDGQALSELMNIYWRPMVAFAMGRVHSQDAAEDLVQEAFVRVWERRRDLRPQASPRSYLYRVLRNLITDVHRRRRLVDRFNFFKSLQDPVETPSPHALLEADEFSAAATRAIDALPERRRDVFVLAHLHDLSYREIADTLGITPRTVANHMTLALTQLRTALAGYTGWTRPASRTAVISRPAGSAMLVLDAAVVPVSMAADLPVPPSGGVGARAPASS